MDVQDMDLEPRTMEQTITDANFVRTHGNNYDQWLSEISNTFKQVKQDVVMLQKLIEESWFRRHNPLKKLTYMYTRVPEIQKLQENFKRYREKYARALATFGDGAHVQLSSEFAKFAGELGDWRKIVEFFETKDLSNVADEVREGNTVELGKLKDQLREKGMEKCVVEDFMASVLEQMKDPTPRLSENNITNVINYTISPPPFPPGYSIPPPNNWGETRGVNYQPNWGNGNTSGPSYSTPTKNYPKDYPAWILCVDRTNGTRSILAQTYLELLRAWSANTTSTWLFTRVDSAGLLSTPLFTLLPSLKTYPPASPSANNAAITLLSNPRECFSSDDYPYEKETILSRMRAHRVRGVVERHFGSYGYILCFTDDVKDSLERMRGKRDEGHRHRSKSRIILLNGCEWFQSAHAGDSEMEKIAQDVKSAVRGFVEREFGWKVPFDEGGRVVGIPEGRERTLMMVLGERYRGRILGREGEFSERLGVRVRLTLEGTAEKNQLVCLTGERGLLKGAEDVIRGLV